MMTPRGPGWYRGLEHSWEVNDYGTTGQNMVSSQKPSQCPSLHRMPSFSAWPLHLPHCLSLSTPHFILEPPESLRQRFLRVGLIGLDFCVPAPANGLALAGCLVERQFAFGKLLLTLTRASLFK